MGYPKVLICDCPYTGKQEEIQIEVAPDLTITPIKVTPYCSSCVKLKTHKGSLYRFTGISLMLPEGILQEIQVKSGKILRLDACRACIPKDVQFNEILVWEVWCDIDFPELGKINAPLYQKIYPHLENFIAECNNVIDLGDWLRLEWKYPSLQRTLSFDMETPLLLRSSLNMKLKIYIAKNELLHQDIFPIPNYDKNPYVLNTEPAISPSGKHAIIAMEYYSYDEESYDKFIL